MEQSPGLHYCRYCGNAPHPNCPAQAAYEADQERRGNQCHLDGASAARDLCYCWGGISGQWIGSSIGDGR